MKLVSLRLLASATFFLMSLICFAGEAPSILLKPVFDEYYSCAEHWEGQLPELGDARGTDCYIQKLEEREGRTWLRSYAENGMANEQWYGWRKNVLAPISGKVKFINVNPTVNEPGILGKGMASLIVLEREDGLNVLLAHVDEINVSSGDIVKAGAVIAKVGNNGQSRFPHIHIGAWKAKTPLQIRFDQRGIPKL